MVAVDQLKSQYTDKYVAVDDSRPELARFRGAVGQIKTVNMNGRALVEFLDYHLNIGWFDIDLSCLKLVDAPPKDVTAKPEPKRAHDKPVGKAAPTSGDKQIKDAAAEKKKLSPLELARQQGAAGAKPGEAASAAGSPKKSTADILAAARGGKPAGEAASAAAPVSRDAPAERAPVEPEAAAAGDDVKRIDKSTMSIADMIAYCRKADAS